MISIFNEIAVENIVPPFVEIRARFELSVNGQDGIEVIRKALAIAEGLTDVEADVNVECFYDGAPFYRVDIRAPDYQVGEHTWEEVNDIVKSTVEGGGGTASAERV